ncbi:phage-related integrase [Aromatoleum aromaticum EbN1]|uniref:Phage-related integrase n=1 Tax=Aromatoleum aromaticum (strain DSM 19018 / LMG 30748 / EbN1) TaxID=76114 RepID=Q5P8W6_AROAE|nr:tyrosine-type recombinase/integrase [Aromatoleum aromaticum]CAI06243.1 phage-related integrase [Aromatoleum aromaticum EbN1]
MPKRERLTPERIRRYTCDAGAKQSFLWDTEAPRLAVRATAGAKSFIFESKLNRQTIRITIGDVRAWGIEEECDKTTGEVIRPSARQEARRLQTLIDQGIDPRQERAERIAVVEAKREEATRQQATVGEAWTVYLEARRPKWGERHMLNHENMAKAGGEPRTRGRRRGESATTQPGPLHSLLALRLSDLDADAVKAWLEPLAQRTPTQAAQTYRALRAFVAWCADRPEYRGIVHADACNRRMARDTLPKARAKDDCLQREQLPLWFEHVRRLSNPVHGAYLQALLITGARREELAGLKWDDVDFQWKSLTIRDKVEGERTIPLTPHVAALLRDLKARNETPPKKPRKLRQSDAEDAPEWKPSPWVFSSRTAASGRLQEPRIGHNKALTAAGLPALSLHGLRRSFGTLAEWVECPAGISAQIMGHKPSAIAEKHYRRRPLDLLRQWHTKIEGWILEQAGIEQPTEEQAGLRVVA